MALALVTGSRPYLRPAATALARTGFHVVTWRTPTRAPAFTRIDPVVGATQWEMPTPPLVSAP